MTFLNQFEDLNIVVVGASGKIGTSFIQHFESMKQVKQIYSLSRSHIASSHSKTKVESIDITDEKTIERASKKIPHQSIDLLIISTGILHTETIMPEKNIKELTAEKFHTLFQMNTVGPALVAKHFLDKMRKDRPTITAFLSAKVGSIGDNYLGGWYSYRASKAALNMIIKNLSIEIGRKNKQAAIIGLHPGTVDSPLSKPFQQNVPEGKLFTAEYSTQKMLEVIDQIKPKDTGKTFSWNGEEIPY